MLLVDKTFEIVTHESAENGEVEDAGFSAIGERVTFAELVNALKHEFRHASQCPANRSTHVWFTTEAEQDMYSGDYRSESIHFSPDNPSRKAKYWIKAMQLAGVKLASHHNQGAKQ